MASREDVKVGQLWLIKVGNLFVSAQVVSLGRSKITLKNCDSGRNVTRSVDALHRQIHIRRPK